MPVRKELKERTRTSGDQFFAWSSCRHGCRTIKCLRSCTLRKTNMEPEKGLFWFYVSFPECMLIFFSIIRWCSTMARTLHSWVCARLLWMHAVMKQPESSAVAKVRKQSTHWRGLDFSCINPKPHDPKCRTCLYPLSGRIQDPFQET